MPSSMGAIADDKKTVRFWDDESLQEKRKEIEWYCGVEVHKHVIV